MIFSSPCCFLLLLSPTQARVCGVLPLICSINCCTEVKVDGSTPKRWRIIRRYDKRIHDYHNYIYQIKFVHLCIQYFRRYLKIFKTTCLAITVFLIFRLKNIDLGWNYNLVSISHSIHYIYFPGGITFVGCFPGFFRHDEKNGHRAHRSCSEVEGVAGWWIHMFLCSPLNWGNERIWLIHSKQVFDGHFN